MSGFNGNVIVIDAETGIEYKLRFDMNALADIQDVTGLNAFDGGLDDLAKRGPKVFRQVFWCGLKQNHPDIDEKTAGRIASMDALQKAFAAMAPDAPAGVDAGNGSAATSAVAAA